MKKLLLLAMVLFFTAMIARVQAANEIDIGLYATSCSDFEVRLSSQFNISNTSLTNVQFAIKYPASVTSAIYLSLSRFDFSTQLRLEPLSTQFLSEKIFR